MPCSGKEQQSSHGWPWGSAFEPRPPPPRQAWAPMRAPESQRCSLYHSGRNYWEEGDKLRSRNNLE